MSGALPEKPLIPLAQAASGSALIINAVNDGGSGITELQSTIVGVPGSGYAYGVFLGHDTATSGYAYGLMGVSDSTTGRGARGWATAGSGGTCGVHGRVESPDGVGISGWANATTGYTYGTEGETQSPDGTGVAGFAYATSGYAASGASTGVYGQTDTPDGTGVWGYASATSGNSTGTGGMSPSPDGTGVWGHATATTGYATGVGARSDSPDGSGVWGHASATTGYGTGVGGVSDSPDGTGVFGGANATTGGSSGVWGMSESPDGVGVGGTARANGCVGVWGQAASGRPGAIPMVAHGTSGQTASLQEWERPDLGTLAVVDASGRLGVGTGSPIAAFQVVRPAAWTNADPLIRLDGDTYNVGAFFYAYGAGNFPFFSGRRSRGSQTSPSAVQANDLLMRYGGAGYGTNAFPSGNRAMLDFYAAENWTNTAQGTYVAISTTTTGASTPSEKVRVTGDGSILPPSDNTGSIGKVGQRWNLVRATTIQNGDLQFENNFIVTEDERVGLAFKNDAGEKIAVLDRKGNFYVKGKIVEGLPS